MQIGLLSLGDWLPDPHCGQYSQTSSERLRSIVDSAVLAERLGFSSVWIGEHHFCDYIVSAPAILLAAIAARTTRLRLGTGVTLLANLDPVRVAEDYASVDALSDGRVEIVAGRGILTQTYEVFGQNPAESREAYREKLELLLRLWGDGAVTWSGATRPPLRDVVVQPRPQQKPRPPVWLGGGSSLASVDLAAELALPLMLPSVLAPPEMFLPIVERYRSEWARHGHDPQGMRVGACNHVHIRRSSQDARAFWKPYFMNYLKFVDRIWVERQLIHPKAKIDFDYDRLLEGVAICGSPAQAVDRMRAIEERLGLDVHLVMFDLGGLPPDELRQTLELFAAEVMPQLAP